MDTFLVYLLLTSFSLSSTSTVRWLPNASLNLPISYSDGKLPCSKKSVVFPQSISGSLDLKSVMEVGSLILPQDGEIILENALISLGVDQEDKNCTAGNSYYLDHTKASWSQAGVWSSSKFTEATPDVERVPCYDDVAEFPQNATFVVQLPDEQQIVRSIKIGTKSYTTNEFRHLVTSSSDSDQQFQLNIVYDLGVVISETSCLNKFGCPCQNNPPTIDCTVKYCSQPSCVGPIKPIGFCCQFCGGHILFEVDDSFSMLSFKEFVDNVIDGYGNTLDYHISVVKTEPHQIQLVVVDKGEYNGNSAEAINTINNKMHSYWFKGTKLSQISGTPLYKRGLGGKIAVSMFFTVVLVMGAIYLYYYKLPTIRLPLRGASMFSRFQYRSDSVVSLTRRDSSVMLGRAAFRNPLYDSKRDKVQVVESIVEDEA